MSLIVKNQKIFENKIDIAVSGLPFEVLLQAMVLSSNDYVTEIAHSSHVFYHNDIVPEWVFGQKI